MSTPVTWPSAPTRLESTNTSTPEPHPKSSTWRPDGEEEQEEEEEKGRLALLQGRLQQFYDGVFGSSDTKDEVGGTRRKLEAKVGWGQNSKLLSIVKVGSIVEEARMIDNRSGKSMEEKRREAEEKVVWISLICDLDLFNS